MELKRRPDGTLLFIINAHNSSQPLYEIEPGVVPDIGPCVHFYHLEHQIERRGPGTEETPVQSRRLLMTLSRGGVIALMRFLPAILSEAARIERKDRIINRQR